MKLAPALTGLMVLTLLTVHSVSAGTSVNSNPANTTSDLVPSINLKSTWYSSQLVSDDEMESWVTAFSSKPEFKRSEGEQLLATLLASGLKSGTVDNNLRPVKSYLSQLDLIQSTEDLPAALGILHRIGIPALFRLDQVGDENQRSVRLSAYPSPAFLALGDYSYSDYVTQMAALDDELYSEMERNVGAFARIDKALLKVAMNEKTGSNQNNSFNWNNFWNQIQVDPADFTTEASQSLVDLLGDLNAIATTDEWKSYLKWRVIETFAPAIGGSWAMVHYSYRLPDAQTPARWKQVTDALDLYLAEDGICRFVPHLISAEAKNQISYRIQLAKSSVRQQILADESISVDEKQRRLHELDAMIIRVGSVTPQVSLDDFSLTEENWMGNLIQLGAWKTRQVIVGSRLPSCSETSYNQTSFQGFVSRTLVQDHVKSGDYDGLESDLTGIIDSWVSGSESL